MALQLVPRFLHRVGRKSPGDRLARPQGIKDYRFQGNGCTEPRGTYPGRPGATCVLQAARSVPSAERLRGRRPLMTVIRLFAPLRSAGLRRMTASRTAKK